MQYTLVTGAAGFIGCAVCIQLLKRGDNIIGIDNHNNYYDPKIKEDKIEPDFVSALKLCKRRRIGPLRPESNRELFYKKDMGILARGGFSFELSKRVLDLDVSEFKKLIKII